MTDQLSQIPSSSRRGSRRRLGVGIGLVLAALASFGAGIVDAETASPDEWLAGMGEMIIGFVFVLAALVWWLASLLGGRSAKRAAAASARQGRRGRLGWTLWIGIALIMATVVSTLLGWWAAANNFSLIAFVWWFVLGVLAVFRRVR